MPEDSVDIANHYNLWRAVLDQAVQDYAYKGQVQRWFEIQRRSREVVEV